MAALVLHINREVIHHGAEVALLRDLYRAQAKWSHPAGAAVVRAPVDEHRGIGTVGRLHRADADPAERQQRVGGERRGQRVVVAAGEQPVPGVGAQRGAHVASRAGTSRVALRRSMRTPEARATWPRSASSPSDTSIIAVAPAFAASGPAAYGGSGTRWALTTTAGERKPRCSTASPAAAQPSRPRTATRSPGRAPPRRTGAPALE